jgi:hypothetical protein
MIPLHDTRFPLLDVFFASLHELKISLDDYKKEWLINLSAVSPYIGQEVYE